MANNYYYSCTEIRSPDVVLVDVTRQSRHIYDVDTTSRAVLLDEMVWRFWDID
jgi:hypothetical protein